MNKKKITIRPLAVAGVLSALSFVLQLIEVSVPLMPAFLKFDLSDLPALLASFALGPIWGVAVCLVKNLLHLSVTATLGIGELSNFLISAVFVAVAGQIYHKTKHRKGALIGCLVGSLACGVFSVASNYLLIYPLYIEFMLPREVLLSMYETILPLGGNLLFCLTVFNLPFTVVKCLLVSAIVFPLYKPLSSVLKGKKRERI